MYKKSSTFVEFLRLILIALVTGMEIYFGIKNIGEHYVRHIQF